MLQSFLKGLTLYGQAFALLMRPQTLRYVMLTGIISIAIGLMIVGGTLYYCWQAYMEIRAAWGASIDLWERTKDILLKIMPLLLWVLGSLLLYKNIILIICGPIMASLSTAVERLVTGKVNETPIPFSSMLGRTIKMALWSTLREILFTLPCLLLNLIPVVGSIASAILIFLIQSYYAGANYSDFILERRGYDTEKSITYIRKHRAEITGIGGGFVLILFVPLLGFILGPAATTIAATLSYLVKDEGQV